MSERFIQLDDFSSVAAGQRPNLSLEVGSDRTYHALFLEYQASGALANQATIESDVEQVDILIDGKVQRSFSPDKLNKMLAYRGVAFETGIIPIYFAEPWLRTAAAEDFFAWGTADLRSMQVKAKLASGALSPVLSAHALIRDQKRNIGQIVKYRNYTKQVAATGEVSFKPLLVDSYRAIHAFSSNIDNLDVEADKLPYVDDCPLTRYESQLTQKGWSPQSGMVTVDFANTGRASDSVDTIRRDTGAQIQKLEARYNMTATGSFEILTESIGVPD